MRSDTIHIRKAKVNDIDGLYALIQDLAVYERSLHELTLNKQQFALDGFGERPLYEAYVATHQGVVVGMALYYYRYSTWKGKRLYLEDFIVNEHFRGKNIGEHISGNLESIA